MSASDEAPGTHRTMNQQELVQQATQLAEARYTDSMDIDEKANVLECVMMELLDERVMTPPVARVTGIASGSIPVGKGPWLMHHDPRLPTMPDKPTLHDFFRLRLMLDGRGGNHLLQSAALAQENGLSEKMVLACLLHDISVIGLIRTDHGHWGAQLVAPYVDDEVIWAIKHHQALKFRPDPALGYEYPQAYIASFGEDYEPPAHVKAEWDYCVGHKWYESAMQICMNDLYAFDPNKSVKFEQFEDIVGRHFKQPPQGLGFDNSPVAHMWRTLIWPNNYL